MGSGSGNYNRKWMKTMEKLAEKGTVFVRHPECHRELYLMTECLIRWMSALERIRCRAESEGSFDACTDDHKRCKTDSKYLQSILEWMRRID